MSMRSSSPFAAGAGVMLSLLLAACSTSPELGHPSIPTLPAAFQQAGEGSAAWDGPWWTSFDDPQLSALVERAIVSNHDVRIALQRVKQARASEVRADAALLPTVSAGGSYVNTQSGFSDAVKDKVPEVRSKELSLDLGWEVDLFGGNRAMSRAASGDLAATEYEAAGARLLTAGEVARYYFVWRAAQDKLVVFEQLRDVQLQAQRQHERRRDEGLDAVAAADDARAESARIEAQLAPVRTTIVAARQHLATLLGTRDMSFLQWGSRAKDWGNVPRIGAGQPSELLWRRPDLLAAESRLRAEGERVETARAQRWPKLFLSALLGHGSLALNGIMNGPARFSNVAAAFAMPLFDGGRIAASIDQQKSVRESAWLSYDQAALRAIEEVETGLARLHNEQDDIDRAAEQLAVRATNLERGHNALREGDIGQLSLLGMQQAALLSRLTFIDARETRALAAVQLYRALGGGWQATNSSLANFTQHSH
jgi:NodT family efflux transporter outer membrane factor (OMF) lipoprotein